MKMRAARLKDIGELTEEQRDEVAQLLKTDTLIPLEPDEFYVMKGYHLISMFNTLAGMKLEIDDLRKEVNEGAEPVI